MLTGTWHPWNGKGPKSYRGLCTFFNYTPLKKLIIDCFFGSDWLYFYQVALPETEVKKQE
jgi:hypothetical protein